MSDDELEIQDTSRLTDADWSEINRLQTIYKRDGLPGFNLALNELMERDLVRYGTIVAAFFPREFDEALKDELAARGLEEDDLRELIRKLENPSGRIQ